MSRFQHRGGFARPENALKRADELQLVGQKLSALQQLHDVVTSKKHRTWSKTYEEIMFKLIDLCVEMKKRNHAKEALMQYRNMCQQVNINSLEEVIKYYLNKATEKAEEARQQAEVCAGQCGASSSGSSRTSHAGTSRISSDSVVEGIPPRIQQPRPFCSNDAEHLVSTVQQLGLLRACASVSVVLRNRQAAASCTPRTGTPACSASAVKHSPLRMSIYNTASDINGSAAVRHQHCNAPGICSSTTTSLCCTCN
jgi:hypothetical protein